MRSFGKLFIKLPLYWSFRTLGKPILLPFNLTFSLTYRCNSRCKTCNIWKIQHKIPINEELTTEEWIKIIKGLKDSPFWITLSGGEPFLRKDIIDIINAIDIYNGPAIINIPTNGLVRRTPNIVEEILELISSDTKLIINFSIDGIGKLHDFIRGIPGNWAKVLDAYKKTKALKRKYSNLIVGIHTVISRWNVDQIQEISKYLIENLLPDQYITEIAEERNEMENFANKPTPTPTKYAKAINFLISLIKQGIKDKRWHGITKITEAFRIEYYKYVRDLYLRRDVKLKSYAGFATAQISPIGDVWECAVYASKMGNLRDFNYSFQKLWKSYMAEKVRYQVKKEHRCPLANEAYANMLLNVRILLRVLKTFLFG
ncbi:MAG: radical SAM/SPASM domain-containing protein [Candidatus Njordarchaeia archaeon]